jgi:hypothetical protein
MQPLATCMHSLQVSKMAIGLQIIEPWLREYQVSTFNNEDVKPGIILLVSFGHVVFLSVSMSLVNISCNKICNILIKVLKVTLSNLTQNYKNVAVYRTSILILFTFYYILITASMHDV